MSKPRHPDPAETVISLAIVALALFVLLQTLGISAEGGYSAVGPRFSPLLVAIGLAIVGALLLREAVAGGWRGMEQVAPGERFHRAPFLWIAGALVIHMAIIGVIGFTLASTLLFAAVARGFGSHRLARDLAIGFAVALTVFLLFTRVLSLSLPGLVPGYA